MDALKRKEAEAAAQRDAADKLGKLATGDGAKPLEPLQTRHYLPEDDDEDIEESTPFTMVSMLREVVNYYAGIGDAQTAAHMLLLVGPLLPRTASLPVVEIKATALAYIECFTNAGYTHDDIQAILDDNFDSVIRSGLQPLQIEAILSTYHEQLIKRKLFNEATILRKLSYCLSCGLRGLSDG